MNALTVLYIKTIFRQASFCPLTFFFFAVFLFLGCQPQDRISEMDQQSLDNYLAHLDLEGNMLIISSVTGNLTEPWEITWGPDNWIWFTEHPGTVSRVNPETGERKVILRIEDVHYEKSRGLLSMVLHPDFEREPAVFLHYTYLSGDRRPDSIQSRLVRYHYSSTGDTLINPRVLLDSIPGKTYHNGSRMIITPQDKVILATGDAGNLPGAQDTTVLSGKLLRLNVDGTVPEDNPIPGSYVYSWGHRNAQGLTYGKNNILYSSEHGPHNDDEINIIQPGQNYGWPDVEGYCDKEPEKGYCDQHDIMEPMKTWTPTIAPAGLDYYGHSKIEEWENSLLLATLKGRSLRVLELDDTGNRIVREHIYFQKEFGRLRDLCVSPEGDIFLATSNTDWHPEWNPWMYDNLPRKGYDRIIRLAQAGPRLLAGIAALDSTRVLREDSAQMNLYPENYLRLLAENKDNPGARIYLQQCAECHLPDGQGIKGLIPSLSNTEWVTGAKDRLISTVLNGLSERIIVNGVAYEQEMPGFSASLTDEEIALILTYIRNNFGNAATPVEAEEVSTVRERARR